MTIRTLTIAACAFMTSATYAQTDPAVQKYAGEAETLRAFATTPAANDWMDQAAKLTPIEPRTRYYSFRPKRGLTPEQYEALSEADREGLTEGEVETGSGYYETFYGTPIAYVRAFDLATAALGEGFEWDGARVFDLGYGQIGQLRMLALAGAEAVGSDVDPILPAFYSEAEDQGSYGDAGGSVKLVHGAWPSDEATAEAVGGGYDLIVSRNLLKRGYVRPTNGSDAWVDFGMSHADLLKTFHDTLAPGGVLMIYSLGGKHPEGKYSPSADHACPWTAEEFAAAGFKVVEIDVDESPTAREVGRAMGWEERMTLETDLFGSYTIVRRGE